MTREEIIANLRIISNGLDECRTARHNIPTEYQTLVSEEKKAEKKLHTAKKFRNICLLISLLCWVIILPAVILFMPKIHDQIGDDPSYSLFSSIVKISFLSLIALIVALCIHSRAKKALNQLREKLPAAKAQRDEAQAIYDACVARNRQILDVAKSWFPAECWKWYYHAGRMWITRDPDSPNSKYIQQYIQYFESGRAETLTEANRLFAEQFNQDDFLYKQEAILKDMQKAAADAEAAAARAARYR